MHSFTSLYLITLGLIMLLWVDLKFKYSYQEVVKMLDKINVRYTVNEYLSKALSVSLILIAVVYGTIQEMTYTLFLIALTILFLPYLNYIHCVRVYKEKVHKEVFDYINTILTYLNEDRTVIRALMDARTVIDDPIRKELDQVLEKIKSGQALEEALVMLNNYDELKKLNQLMIAKGNDGAASITQYKILSSYVEQLEKLYNDYKMNIQTKRRGFYIVVAFSLVTALFIKTMFQVDLMGDLKRMQEFYFWFYLFHLILILFFEQSYAKKRGQR